MLSPPDGLSEVALASALAGRWKVAVASIAYRAVGFGSHHWEVIDTHGDRWFVTADDLETLRLSRGEPPDAAFGRLRASLGIARDLREHGRSFVVAPVSTLDGESLARVDERFGLALYPYVDGESFDWGEFSTPEHRQALVDLIVDVHSAPESLRRQAIADDFAIPHRDELEAALTPADQVEDCGPYARPASALLAENTAPIQRLLARYDALVAEGRTQLARAVLTHGEPHPGNTMLTSSGSWLLIDWDTARVAPPERDLWLLDPGDGSVLAAYADATGVTPLPSMLELYRVRWDLTDLTTEVSRFRRAHTGGADDGKAWDILRAVVAYIGS